VGFGAIGRQVATRARALGMRVLAVRRHPDADPSPADEQWGIERLDELLGACDAVVLCPPLTDATRGILSRERIARLSRSAVVINLGRGALVDEPALIDALRSGHVRHAGLDVFDAEPLKPDHPLARMENATVTAHAAFRTLEASMTLMRRAIDIVRGIVQS
jgi:D-3-phosphoglycerate dehydrogenase